MRRLLLARRLLAYVLLVSPITACAGQSPPSTSSQPSQLAAGSPADQAATTPVSTEGPPMVSPSADAAASATAGAVAAETPTDKDAALTPVADPPASSIPEGSFQNPVLNQDFPDPSVLDVEGTFYAYATTGSDRNVQLARSSDLIHWEQLSDALPVPPAWAIQLPSTSGPRT